MTGPEVGGTVVSISDTIYCTEEADVYCKFENDQWSEVTDAFVVAKKKINCLSPMSNGPNEIKLSYAFVKSNCPFEETDQYWIDAGTFTYDSDVAGVVATPADIAEGLETTLHFIANSRYIIRFNSDLMKLQSGLDDDDPIKYQVYVNKIRVLNSGKTEQKEIQTEDDMDAETFDKGKYNLKINSMSDDKVSFITVNIRGYTTGKNNSKRAYVVKSTKLIGLVPEALNKGDYCRDDKPTGCVEDDVEPIPCPSDYTIGSNDPNFEEDDTCVSGSSVCDDKSDLSADLEYACNLNSEDPSWADICSNVSEYEENCNCKYFKGGKAPTDDPDATAACNANPEECKWVAGACLKSEDGLSQCCYTKGQGPALIKSITSGAGRRLCGSESVIDNFASDVLPYLVCCKADNFGGLCDDYSGSRPVITDAGYVSPPSPSQCFGDPHMQSFDKAEFDFNGNGEYVMFCGSGSSLGNNLDNCHPARESNRRASDTVSVNYRFTRLEEEHEGTVIVGVAVQDPTYKNGDEYITAVAYDAVRIKLFSGPTEIKFPKSRKGKMRKKGLAGAKFELSPDVTSEDYNLRLTFKSGLVLRVRESGGALTIGFLRRSKSSDAFVGVMGTPDKDSTNDFIAANGTVLDATTYPDVKTKYEAIFKDVGSTWNVPVKENSLFLDLSGSLDFENFHYPDKLPNFEGVDPTEGCELDICAPYTGFLRASCCFDFTITGDSRLVAGIMNEAQKEKDVQVIINNTIPVLLFPNATASLELGENKMFDIIATDPDPDTLLAIMERSDRKLFQIKYAGVRGEWELTFTGTQLHGTYAAEVLITDGIGWAQFSVTVVVNLPPCNNDRKFKYDNVKGQTCAWVGENGRQEKCLKEAEVRRACQMTCGICCEDDKTYEFKEKKGFVKKCDWITKKTSRKSYCSKLNIRSNCPVACDACKEKFKCINDHKFKFEGQTCANVMAARENIRQDYCAQSDVYQNCPTSCGVCCEDDADYLRKKLESKKKGKKKVKVGCDWIRQKPKRIADYCADEKTAAACPSVKTCNTCKPFVEPAQ